MKNQFCNVRRCKTSFARIIYGKWPNDKKPVEWRNEYNVTAIAIENALRLFLN
jgi:hypothetical protein